MAIHVPPQSQLMIVGVLIFEKTQSSLYEGLSMTVIACISSMDNQLALFGTLSRRKKSTIDETFNYDAVDIRETNGKDFTLF